MASLRRDAYERVIEEEAERQAREIEKTRYRYNELMTGACMQAAEWLENAQPSDLRGQDVLKIIGLHLDAIKFFGPTERPREADTCSEQDEIEIDRIIREVEEGDYPEEEDLL